MAKAAAFTSPQSRFVLRNLLSALDFAGDLAYVWDVASDALYWYGPAAARLGVRDLAAVGTGKRFGDRIHPDDRALRQSSIAAHLGEAEPFECEFRVRGDSGSVVWVQDRGRAEVDADGRVFRLTGMLRIVTGRKAEEQRLERLANYDELTGHFNRMRLRQGLDQALASAL
ncbi:MAG TPA: PAS domain-containing protein, partial [Stellaceae bacterium]|nr:PAS domain-containing protein [Stellaceae bacterium]